MRAILKAKGRETRSGREGKAKRWVKGGRRRTDRRVSSGSVPEPEVFPKSPGVSQESSDRVPPEIAGNAR